RKRRFSRFFLAPVGKEWLVRKYQEAIQLVVLRLRPRCSPRKPASRSRRAAPLLPERGNGFVDGGGQRGLAGILHQSNLGERLAQGSVAARDLKRDTLGTQLLAQPRDHVRPCDIDISYRLYIHQEPAQRRWTGSDETAHPLHEVIGVGKEQRCIEAICD